MPELRALAVHPDGDRLIATLYLPGPTLRAALTGERGSRRALVARVGALVQFAVAVGIIGARAA